MISIAMATYNGEKYLREQIDSILNQTIQDFELIVCDDCSTDTTWNILQDYQSQDRRIKCYRNEENLGFKKNFEKAIGLCTGEYIALSDQDDVWLPNHLEILKHNIGNCDLCAGNALFVDAKMSLLNLDMLTFLRINFIPKNDLEWLHFLVHRNVIQGAACLFRRQLSITCLPSPDTCKFHDYWLALNAALNNGIKYIENPILYYRQHNHNVTGFHRLSLRARIKRLYGEKKNKYESRRQLSLLNDFLAYCYHEDCHKIIRDAISYYQNDVLHKKKVRRINYFIKNYKYMHLSNDIKLFIFLFMKEVFFK